MRRINGCRLLGVIAWLWVSVGLAGPRSIEAGPLWNQKHAERSCPGVCAPHGGWTGHWWTTVEGQMSVCQCAGSAPTQEELREQFVAHVRKGRELVQLKLWREARAEFQAARALRPENLQVLHQVCEASLQLGDVPAASEACRMAEIKANTPGSKALALNHLGQLAELEGFRTTAITAYRKSLELQPDPSVRKRLRLLTGEHGEKPRPHRPRPAP